MIIYLVEVKKIYEYLNLFKKFKFICKCNYLSLKELVFILGILFYRWVRIMIIY